MPSRVLASLLVLSGAAWADGLSSVPAADYTVNTVALFSSDARVPGFKKVGTAGYYSAGDGMGGTYSKLASGSCTADGGYCLHDSAGNSWTLDGFAQHPSLRNYGCTSALTSCATQFSSLMADAVIVGAGVVYGDGLHWSTATTLVPARGVVFDGGATATLPPSSSAWTTLPGTIEFDESAGAISYSVNNTNSGLQNVHILNKAARNLTNSSSLRTLLDVKQAFEVNTPTAIVTNARGAVLRNVDVLGFSRCFDIQNTPDLVASHLTGHCGKNGGIYLANNHDTEHLDTLRLENTLFKNNANGSAAYTISSIIAGPSGECEYVLSSASVLATHDDLTITGVAGSCDVYSGNITVIDATHVYFPGTHVAPSSAIAGTWEDAAGRRDIVALASINDDIQDGSSVSSSACDPGGLAVVDRPNNHSALNLVQLSAPLNTGCTSATFTFTNPAYVIGGTATVDSRTVDAAGIYSASNDGVSIIDSLALSYRKSYEIDHDTSWIKCSLCRDDGGSTTLDQNSVSVYAHGTGSSGMAFNNFTFKAHGKSIVYDNSGTGAASSFIGGTMGDTSDPGGLLDQSAGRLQIANEGSISTGFSFIGSSIDQLNLDNLSNKNQNFRLLTAATALAIKPTASWIGGASDISGLLVGAYYQGSSGSWSPNSTSAVTMGGFGGSITPKSSGIVEICGYGYVSNSTVAAFQGMINFQPSYGTGSSPSRNHALTGTQIGVPTQTIQNAALSMMGLPLNNCGIAVLTVGTTYWLDVAGEAETNTTNTWNGAIIAHELM